MRDSSARKNQSEPARAVRPQTVTDAVQSGGGYYESGNLPKGGFQSMWCFGKRGDSSSTTKPEPGNRIISKGK
jgi:hypothetical protein